MKLIVAGNWKMNGSSASVGLLAGRLAREHDAARVQMLLFPPFVYLEQVSRAVSASQVRLGAQNVAAQPQGALTGEIDTSMLLDVGCEYCLVGHSERRHQMMESNEQVAEKYAACLRGGLKPVLCVGESLSQRRSNETLPVVAGQLEAVRDLVGDVGLAGGIVAYEPVWAIGTGESASPAQAEEVHQFIRGWLADAGASDVSILYGGSVKASNAGELFAMDNIDGALVGGASLDATEFLSICAAAADKTEE